MLRKTDALLTDIEKARQQGEGFHTWLEEVEGLRSQVVESLQLAELAINELVRLYPLSEDEVGALSIVYRADMPNEGNSHVVSEDTKTRIARVPDGWIFKKNGGDDIEEHLVHRGLLRVGELDPDLRERYGKHIKRMWRLTPLAIVLMSARNRW